MKTKTAVWVGITALIFFLLGYGARSLSTPAVFFGDGGEIKQKIEKITQVDYPEYLALKSLEEKYKKADEILGKVMQIFLLDLSLHVAEKAGAGLPPELINKVSDPEPAPSLALSPAQNTLVKGNSGGVSPGALTVSLSELREPAEIDSFLKSHETENFKKTLFDSKVVSKPNPNLSGCYEGEAQLLNGKRWIIKMFHQFEDVSSSNKGNGRLVMSEDGKVFSNSRSNGTSKHIRGIESAPDEILIEASPDEYFQLFYLPTQEGFAGNLYQKQKDDQVALKGKISLRRGSRCDD